MGAHAPPAALTCHRAGVAAPTEKRHGFKDITIALDIAKSVFHAHGADERCAMVFGCKLTRGKLVAAFTAQPACLVALSLRPRASLGAPVTGDGAWCGAHPATVYAKRDKNEQSLPRRSAKQRSALPCALWR